MVREAALVVHRWVGLGAGLLVALLGATGSVLVYEAEIDRALNPDLLRVAPPSDAAAEWSDVRISPGAALRAMRASDVSGRPGLLRMPQGSTEPYVFWVSGADGEGPRREVMVDPYTARVLGSRAENSGPMGVLFRLHTDLMAGPVGHEMVGGLGVVLLLLAATGVIVWFPRKLLPRRLWSALTVRRDVSARRTNYDLHRAGGAWTLLYVVLLAGTGAGLIFYQTTGDLLNAVTGSDGVPAPPSSSEADASFHERPAGLRPSTLDEAWRSARAALPEAEFTYVALGAETGQLLSFRGRMPSELHPNGRSFVWFDRWSGRRLRVDDASRYGAGPTLLHAIYPLHIGTFEVGPVGEEVWRAVWAVLGIAPGGLAVTGFLVWWFRGS